MTTKSMQDRVRDIRELGLQIRSKVQLTQTECDQMLHVMFNHEETGWLIFCRQMHYLQQRPQLDPILSVAMLHLQYAGYSPAGLRERFGIPEPAEEWLRKANGFKE